MLRSDLWIAQTRWGVGFGPRDCSDYQTGVSVIPIDRLTEADQRWMVSAEYGGTGGQPLQGGMCVEEPDIEIGQGVSSKGTFANPPILPLYICTWPQTTVVKAAPSLCESQFATTILYRIHPFQIFHLRSKANPNFLIQPLARDSLRIRVETRGPDPPTILMQAGEEEVVVVPPTEATSGRTTTTREVRIPVNVEHRERRVAATTLGWRLLPRDLVRGSRFRSQCSSSSSRTLASNSRAGRSRHLADKQKQQTRKKKPLIR